ncbi:unnamed protein product [Rhizoctonia solani]|uniref:pH-response regulator protein palC n=1 Tax=Rhizoctonia solani TaxID=456999 RepID=A0A8H3AJQ9_9AGAM|nr:unnamed protein product [Rhizoctonia solani]
MSGYVYDLPTTGALSLSELCTDITGSHAANLARATEARANVRAILKASRRTDAGERDYLKVVKALDEYLPFVNAIIASVAADDLTLAQEPIFSWRSTLSHSTLSDPPRINVHGLHSELAFVLHSSAYALSNLAAASIASLGTYERDRALPDADRRAKDEKLTFAVKLLCRAAGTFTHIAQVVIPELGKVGGPRPPELREDVANALAKLALADAHALSVRKLLTRSAVQAALSPGPPLPQGHPPPAFVAKIYLHTASLFASARGLTDTSQRKLSLLSRGGPDNAEVSQDLRRYLEEETALIGALAHKWLGVDAGEAGRTGDAVGYLKWAKSELESLKEGKLARFKKSGNVDGKMKKERSVEELESVGTFLGNYMKVNDSVNFQPVPTSSSLQSTIPAGMSVVTEKTYEAPMPAFGPGTPDYVARHVQKLDIDTNPAESERKEEDDRDYGLKGSYF